MGDKIFIILMAAIVLSVGLAVIFLPQESFSENENRMLTTWEDIDPMAELSRGTLGERLSALYSDQFPFRTALIECKATAELLFGKSENGGVIPGQDGALIPRCEYSGDQKDNLRKNLDAINKFCERVSARVTFAVAPRAVDVLKSRLPSVFSPERAESAWELFDGTDFVDLKKFINEDGYNWFLTDHHWTARGARLAYEALAEPLGYTPFFDFEAVTVSESFCGTSWSKSGMYGTCPDKIELMRFSGDENFCVTDAEKIISGLYDEEKLETKDKYSVFLGGDYGHVKISDGEEKPRLLVIKDSYFNALAPFLCRHFELDVIDLRYFSGSVAKYAREQGIGEILILCGIDSLASAPTFEALVYGTK
ncbi:MAG: hypothetical protein E7640_05005 [Ruminococcaceae bacterium]|nr:hypothetical protein [Oscillospiraceae bacterium]